jgi:hypothetical protein
MCFPSSDSANCRAAFTGILGAPLREIQPPPGPADPKDMSDTLREAVGSFYRSIFPDYGTAHVVLKDFEVAGLSAPSQPMGASAFRS